MKIWKKETPGGMILYRRKSNSRQSQKVGLKNEPYLFINLFFGGVITLVIAYSGIFSPENNNYPVTCIHQELTGEPCVSCGLSHSFSLIVRGKIDEAYQWNIYGIRVFLFFVSQLLLRVVFSIYYIRNSNSRKQLIIFDCIGSGLLFLISFWPFLVNIISGVLTQFSPVGD